MTNRFPHSPHEDSDYIGEATIVIRGTEVPAHVEIKGYREPIDGIFRWIGRISPNEQLTEILANQTRVRATIRTSHGARDAFVGDPDPWNRYRIIGKSTPPYHVPTEPDQGEDGSA
ncbi:DUF4873 domain-containing protein [Nocardia sp. BSTN01]|uniref:DUF4873 domain-containing protein n=1 Tax=Nocardia sp. BSTN01 TaxID=2783665 RepID=UPI0018909AD7|nr:DUF4873 domain-containing protein [Nocardia sp. BSTN01]MBF5000514.1 DUF4873 domain-containing protein [Nocardia sp. BSTN01]